MANPPFRSVRDYDSSYRPRSYKDIPYIKMLSFFAEDNAELTLGRHTLNLQAGLRYDRVSVVGGTFCPRVNVAFDLVPDVLTLRGGYGITAKMPTLTYLYPQKATMSTFISTSCRWRIFPPKSECCSPRHALSTRRTKR